MRITLDIPDGIICGFLNCVEHTNAGLQLVSYQLSSDDFTDGNTVKLPRERKEGADWERAYKGTSFQKLADKYGVSKHTIQNAINGKTWKCVSYFPQPPKGE